MRREARIIQRAVSAAYRRIYAVVARIPRGRVMTYGAVARLAGMPRGARVVGYAMSSCQSRSDRPVPWQRVVGLRRAGTARVSIKDPVGGAEQRRLLEREGVRFSDDDGIDLERYGVGPETPRGGGSRKRRGRPGRPRRPR
jgi:methylated-DNA-protein-cysteine methyltransferase-like protein